MHYVFDPIPPVSILLADGSSAFPVRRIHCVGRNYSAHIGAMGVNPNGELSAKPDAAGAVVARHKTESVSNTA